MINCSLKPSPEKSSGDALGEEILAKLASMGASSKVIRAVDHNIMPGVQVDMGEGDDWPNIRKSILSADIVILVTPTWLGQHSSVAQRVLERLNAETAEKGPDGTPIMFGKVALPVIVGNEDGAHHISGILTQSLSDIGFSIPAQPAVYWNGEAMHKVDFNDLAATPEPVSEAIAVAAKNSIHLARLLRDNPYPS